MSLADIVAIAGFRSQPPHCNSCFLMVGSLSAFASINAVRVAAKYIPVSAASHSEGDKMQRWHALSDRTYMRSWIKALQGLIVDVLLIVIYASRRRPLLARIGIMAGLGAA